MEPHGSARLTELLSEFTEAIRGAGFAQLFDKLRPGLSADQVRAGFHEIGLHPPGEVVAWFAWADGSNGWMLPYWRFVPLNEVLQRHKMYDKGPGAMWGRIGSR